MQKELLKIFSDEQKFIFHPVSTYKLRGPDNTCQRYQLGMILDVI